MTVHNIKFPVQASETLCHEHHHFISYLELVALVADDPMHWDHILLSGQNPLA